MHDGEAHPFAVGAVDDESAAVPSARGQPEPSGDEALSALNQAGANRRSDNQVGRPKAQFGAGLMDRQRMEPARNAYTTLVVLPRVLPDLAYRYVFDRPSFYQEAERYREATVGRP